MRDIFLTDEILLREKQLKFNTQIDEMSNKFEKHNQLITEYAEKLSEDLKITLDEAKDLMNAVFTEFPKVKQFIDDSQKFAKTF